MRQLRVFLSLVRWDCILELRRLDAVLNMSLFAVFMLWLASFAVSSNRELQKQLGPLIFWIAILFAGTVGLSRAFLVEQTGGVLTGVLTAPVDHGIFYLAKVAATWLYMMVMELFLLGAYIVLFNFTHWERVPFLFGTMAAFTLGYAAVGIVIAGMTAVIRGGEVVLRVLLFPVLVPMVIAVLEASEMVFPGMSLGESERLSRPLVILIALDTIYLTVGYVLFPRVVEE